MRVSVCIAVYNGADYLETALRSVRDQTYRDFEVIVLDDGSTDSSPLIVEEFGFRLIRQTNQGIGASRKRLLEEATGDWIAFLDHDDYWAPNFLERMLQQSDDPKIVHVYCDAKVFAPGEQPTHRPLPSILGPESLGHIIPQRIWNPCSLFRREALLQLGGFRHSLRACEDWQAWFSLATLGNLRFVDEQLVYIMRRPNSTSAPTVAYYDAEKRVITEILDNLDSLYPQLPPARRKFYRRKLKDKLGLIFSLQGRAYASSGDRQLARKSHSTAIRLAPLTKGVWYRWFRNLVFRG